MDRRIFQATFHSINSGIIITDQSGITIRIINPAAEKITGWSESEAAGESLHTIFTLSNEKNGEKVVLPFRRILEKEISVRFPSNILLHTRDKRVIPVIGDVSPLYDEKGTVYGNILTFYDFSSERSTEKKVEKARYYAENIIDAIENFLVILDSDLTILSANKAFYRRFGLKPEQIIGKYIHAIDGGIWDISELTQILKEVIKDNTPFENYEINITRNDNKSMIVLLNGHLIRRSNKKILLLLTIQDITDEKMSKNMLKILEEKVTERTIRLQDANRDLESFSYFVSHDLRAPLRHIMGYIDLFNRDFPDLIPKKSKHYLDTITESSRQMSILIEELLNYSRIGRKEIRKQVSDMNIIIKDAQEIFKNRTYDRCLVWEVSVLPAVSCDPTLISLVWINLLGNAVKFTKTREKAEIKIGFREEEKEFVFFIADNGVGFNMDYAEKLFQIFQRLHSSKEYPGTGIGLAHVHRIIGKHGGRTWVESEEGIGTTVYFTLPKQEELDD